LRAVSTTYPEMTIQRCVMCWLDATDDLGPLTNCVTHDQLEFFPPKGNGQPITSQFIQDAMPSNLFPHVRKF
jgi:hypothetical protein